MKSLIQRNKLVPPVASFIASLDDGNGHRRSVPGKHLVLNQKWNKKKYYRVWRQEERTQ